MRRSKRVALAAGVVLAGLAVGVAWWCSKKEPVRAVAERAVAGERVEAEEQEREREGERRLERGDQPDAAMDYRRMMYRDGNGYIPPDGLIQAKRHADLMRRDAANRRRAMGSMVDASGIDTASWSWLGPGNIGGRIRSIVVDPTNPSSWLVGSVGGGIWHSSDAGASWSPVNDFLANLAVVSMAMQPGSPNVIYAGTGEGTRPIDGLQGAGIFKSTDSGVTWTQLSSTTNQNFYYVNRIAVTSTGVLLAATAQGLFRSLDGGRTFTSVATTSEWHGFLDVAFNPTDSSKAVASGYKTVWYSADGGATWKVATGLPSTAGRVEVAYAPISPSTVYASVDYQSGAIYKSGDGGATFALVSTPGHLSGQGWYANTIWVDPTNASNVVVGGLDLWRSTNGGTNFTQISDWRQSPNSAHADHHMIVSVPNFDGSSVKTVIFANDGGIYSTNDVFTVGSNSTHTSGWISQNHNLGITQFYGAGGNATTGTIVAGAQDNGTVRFTTAGGPQGYTAMFGGDGGYAAADPQDSNYFYGEYVYLNIHRSTDGGRTSSYIYKGIDDAKSGNALFIAPFILDPNNSSTMLAGGLQLWRSTNVKASTPGWASIKSAGSYPISAIAVAPGNSDICWTGQADGQVFVTSNCTQTTPSWSRVDSNGLPSGRMILRVTVDPANSSTAYVSLGGFTSPNLWRTTNQGVSWTAVNGSGSGALPAAPVHDLAVLPTNSSILFAATEVGIFSSADQGATWLVPTSGPANVSVDQLFFMGNKLVAVTHGRGLFTVTPNPAGSAACTTTVTGAASGTAPAVKDATPVTTIRRGPPGLPGNGTWQRKVKADGSGETWTYNFTIADEKPGASSTVQKTVTPVAASGTGGGSRQVQAASPAPSAVTASDGGVTVSAVGPDSGGPTEPPTGDLGGGFIAPRRLLPASTIAGVSAGGGSVTRRPSTLATPIAAPISEDTGVASPLPRSRPGIPATGALIQQRFVQDSDPRRPSAKAPNGWLEVWNESAGAWVGAPSGETDAAKLRARATLVRRVVADVLPGKAAGGSALAIARAGGGTASAHLAGATALGAFNAFPVTFDNAASARAASVHVYAKVRHSYPDALTIWLRAGTSGKEAVLWDGRGGDKADLEFERVFQQELRDAPLAEPWTLYIANADTSGAAAELTDFRILVTPEATPSNSTNASTSVDLIALLASLNTAPGRNGDDVATPALGQPVYLTFDWQLTGTSGTVKFSQRALLDGVYYCGLTDTFDAGYWTTWCLTPWNVTSGPHTLEWDLDYNNAVNEADKTNNSAYLQFSPAAGLDVSAQRAYLLNGNSNNATEVATPALGQTVYVAVDFAVSGASGDITLPVQALLDGNRYCSGTFSVGNGSWYTQCKNGWVVTGGNHTLEWDFDIGRTLPIPDRSDNSVVSNFSVSGLNLTAQTAYLMDGAGSGNVVQSPRIGQVVYFTFDWLVSGADAAPVNVPQRALLDGKSYCSFTVSVSSGAWTSWCQTGWSATGGSHTLEFDLDPTNTLLETDKTDNVAVTRFGAAGLDLIAERAYLRTAAGDGEEVPSPVVGQTVYLTLDWTVTGASGNVRLVQRALLDGATYCDFSGTVSNGSWYDYCSTGWVATAGQHQLEWRLNYDKALAETNYNNNNVTGTFTTAGLDLIAKQAFLSATTTGTTGVTAPTTGQQLYPSLTWTVTGATGNVSVPIRALIDGSAICSTTASVTNGNFIVRCSSPWTVTAGTHTLQWDLDPGKTLNELDRSNNSAVLAFSTADPDLVALRSYLRTDTNGLGVEVDAPTAGQAVYFTFDWQFNGAGNAVAVTQRALLDGVAFCNLSTSAAPGTSWTSWCSNAWTASSGTHTVRWDLDYNNLLLPAKATKSTSKSFATASSGATLDLVALRSYLKSDTTGGGEVAQPVVGQTVYFYLDWQVTGTGNAVAVSNRALLDGTVYCTGTGTASPPSNWSSWCNTGWVATAGAHTVRWDIDFNNTVSETNKNNNSASTTFTPSSTGPTLDIAAVRAYLQTAATGGTEVAAPAVGQTVFFFVDWQLSGASSNTAVTERATLDGSVYCSGSETLGNGNYSSRCGQGWTVTSGPHSLQWDLNYNNTVAESNPNNNSAITRFTPTDTTQGVDLTALKAYVKTAALTAGTEVDPPTAAQRVYPTLDWQVTGTGNVVVTQRALIDGAQVCSCAVPVSAGSKFVSSCTQAWNVTSGSHKLQWDLNYDGSINEGNRSNNTATKQYTVK